MNSKGQTDETLHHLDSNMADNNMSETTPPIKLEKDNIPSSSRDRYSRFSNPSIQTHIQKKTVGSMTIFEVEIESHYEILEVIGKGAYGTTFAAKDTTKGNELIAIKKIEKAGEHKIFLKRLLRELKIQRLLEHENILGIKTILLPKSREEIRDIHTCSPLMETDLGSIIKSSQPLSNDHVKFFLYQILRGLKYLHSAGIVHTNLMHRNFLINSNCDLKICDFTLAEFVHFQDKTKYRHGTYNERSRWYQAPERILKDEENLFANDVWSIGCIFAELIRRKPFFPSTDSKTHLELVFDVFGTPSEDLMAIVKDFKMQKFLRSLKKKEPKKLESIFPADTDPLALDLLGKMMTLDWRERITVEEALEHPYLKDLHCLDDEPRRDLVSELEFEFIKHTLNLEELKDLLYEEILLYNFEDFREEYNKKIQAGESPFKDVIETASDRRKDRGVDSDSDEE